MVLDDIFERFAQQSPVTVMTRAALEHALSPRAIDALFEQAAQRQYTRTLLFSSVVDLMGSVVAKIQPAVNAAYRARAEALGVSLRAVYDKLGRTEPGVSAELVRHTARTLGPVIAATTGSGSQPWSLEGSRPMTRTRPRVMCPRSRSSGDRSSSPAPPTAASSRPRTAR